MASANLNGPVLSAAGTAGLNGTQPGSISVPPRTTLVVNDDQLGANGSIYAGEATICARRAQSRENLGLFFLADHRILGELVFIHVRVEIAYLRAARLGVPDVLG